MAVQQDLESCSARSRARRAADRALAAADRDRASVESTTILVAKVSGHPGRPATVTRTQADRHQPGCGPGTHFSLLSESLLQVVPTAGQRRAGDGLWPGGTSGVCAHLWGASGGQYGNDLGPDGARKLAGALEKLEGMVSLKLVIYHHNNNI
jgi:hypothetical protein